MRRTEKRTILVQTTTTSPWMTMSETTRFYEALRFTAGFLSMNHFISTFDEDVVHASDRHNASMFDAKIFSAHGPEATLMVWRQPVMI